MIRIHINVVFALAIVMTIGCAQLTNWSDADKLAVDDGVFDHSQIDVKFGLTRIVERNGEIEDAKRSYLEIIEQFPDYSPALHRLGVIEVRQENLEKAIRYLETALQHDTNSADVLGDLGYAHLLLCELETAADYLNRAFQIAPENERVVNNLALALGYQGLINEALTMFRRVNIESQALTNVGYILSQRGELEKAAQYFHQALDMDPSIEQAGNGLIELDRILQAGPAKNRPASPSKSSPLISTISDS